MKTALVLIDIQQDYFPGGRMELVGSEEASKAAGRLLNAFREKGLPLVHVQHISMRKGATFFLPDTDGIKLHENVRPSSNEAVVVKHYPNSFRETDLRARLEKEKIERLVLCGMMTHMCVDATVRAAFDSGYTCVVAHDACATRDLSFQELQIPAGQVHAGFMAALASAYAQVVSADEAAALISS